MRIIQTDDGRWLRGFKTDGEKASWEEKEIERMREREGIKREKERERERS